MAARRPIISFGHASDTTGFDIEFNIFLPIICDLFPNLRNRQNSASFTPTGQHHLRIGNTAQHGVTHHGNTLWPGRSSFDGPAIW